MLTCEECGNIERFARTSYVHIEVEVDGEDRFFRDDWERAEIGEDLGRTYECLECKSSLVEWR